MSNNIRTIYLHIVSLISLGMIVIGIITLVNSVFSYNFPVVFGYSDYSDEINYKYNDEYIESVKEEKRSSLRDAISASAVVALGVPLYLYHWKKASK